MGNYGLSIAKFGGATAASGLAIEGRGGATKTRGRAMDAKALAIERAPFAIAASALAIATHGGAKTTFTLETGARELVFLPKPPGGPETDSNLVPSVERHGFELRAGDLGVEDPAIC